MSSIGKITRIESGLLKIVNCTYLRSDNRDVPYLTIIGYNNRVKEVMSVPFDSMSLQLIERVQHQGCQVRTFALGNGNWCGGRTRGETEMFQDPTQKTTDLPQGLDTDLEDSSIFLVS